RKGNKRNQKKIEEEKKERRKSKFAFDSICPCDFFLFEFHSGNDCFVYHVLIHKTSSGRGRRGGKRPAYFAHSVFGSFLDCPSSAWVRFQDSCYIFLEEAIQVESLEDVRNQCTDHGADMVSIHNEEENAFILDTLKKQWKGPDDILLGMFFDTDDNHILISALVIASTVILTVLGAIVWFLYKRNSDSGFTTVFSAAPQSPYNDDCVLVVAEENEYAVQFD
uniref:CD302 molecule n=1 Tax=Ursus maritimus TaxID=29073 RepID=A0A452TNK9_URSMA